MFKWLTTLDKLEIRIYYSGKIHTFYLIVVLKNGNYSIYTYNISDMAPEFCTIYLTIKYQGKVFLKQYKIYIQLTNFAIMYKYIATYTYT